MRSNPCYLLKSFLLYMILIRGKNWTHSTISRQCASRWCCEGGYSALCAASKGPAEPGVSGHRGAIGTPHIYPFSLNNLLLPLTDPNYPIPLIVFFSFYFPLSLLQSQAIRFHFKFDLGNARTLLQHFWACFERQALAVVAELPLSNLAWCVCKI